MGGREENCPKTSFFVCGKRRVEKLQILLSEILLSLGGKVS